MIETARLRLIRWEDAHFQAILENNLIKLGELLDVETPTAWTTFDDMTDALPFFYNAFKENGNYWGSFFTIHKADTWSLMRRNTTYAKTNPSSQQTHINSLDNTSDSIGAANQQRISTRDGNPEYGIST